MHLYYSFYVYKKFITLIKYSKNPKVLTNIIYRFIALNFVKMLQVIFQDKCISVSSAHTDFGHHMPHNRYLLPFITTLYSLRKMCFDTNVGYVCHMTIFFVGMFVFIGSVSYVVRISRFIYIYMYNIEPNNPPI